MDPYQRFQVRSRVIFRNTSRYYYLESGKKLPDMTEGVVLPKPDDPSFPDEHLMIRFPNLGDLPIHYRNLESIL